MAPEETFTKEELYDLLVSGVSGFDTLRRLTASGRIHGQANRWKKAIIRPVLLKERRSFQFVYYDDSKSYIHNYSESELPPHIETLILLPWSRFSLRTVNEDIHIRITKRGKILVGRGIGSGEEDCTEERKKDTSEHRLEHDRIKRYPLPRRHPDDFLRTIGIMDQSGKVIPRMQNKYKQVNEFLRLLEQSIELGTEKHALKLIDCGCGNAYLTFAAYHYLNHIKSIPTSVVGIDRNKERIERCRELAESLGWNNIHFVQTDIALYEPEEVPDIVVSLHACDTATDEAIALGVKWKSEIILAAPCCHKELRSQIEAPLFTAIMSHGVLKQRTSDILTDACRAEALRILGYKTDVVQFIDSKHTPKNLLIRAVQKSSTRRPAAVKAYSALRDYWHIDPAIGRYLSDELDPYLSRTEPKPGA